MHLSPNLPLLEELLLCEEENELRDQFANGFYLHQEPKVYQEIGRSIAQGNSIEDAYRKHLLSHSSHEEKQAFAGVAYGMGLDSLQKLNDSIEENPYFKLLKGLKDKRSGKLSFFTREYAPYEVFLIDDEKENQGRLELSLGYYEKGLSFPALSKDGTVWMSLIPHEINTMKQAIASAKGNVLTLGLGLGYYAFMVSQKDEVESVTIVENDPKVIAMFQELLLPSFPQKEKIHIVKGDAFDYVKHHGREFDFTFVDIYHDETDALPLYLRLLHLEQGPTAYWIERAILLYFRRYVLAFLEEQYDGLGEEAYQERHDFPSALFGALFDATEDASIQNDEELKAFLSPASLKDLARKLSVKIT